MRKNSGNREKLTSNLYSTYIVKGYNLDVFLNSLNRRGVEVYSAKKLTKNTLKLSIKYTDNKIFVALAKELCYNVKKLRDNGLYYPILYLFKNIGVFIGAVIFCLSTVFFNDYILGFEFEGSGSIYSKRVEEYLKEQNITKYTRFSDVNLKTLGEKVLQNSEFLSFASCQKVGNRLKFNLVLSSQKVPVLKDDKHQLYSRVNGVIKSIKVYRGTAVKNVGDSVTEGELLVDGYSIIKEQVVETHVLAEVKIETYKTAIYTSSLSGEEDKAIIFAKEQYSSYQFDRESVTAKENNGEYIYTVNLFYVHTEITD